jgi:futalosine hydrolase
MRLREKLLAREPARLLVVTAVAVERDAFLRGRGSDPRIVVIDGGVGAARAAAATAVALTRAAERGEPFLAVISAGIGGGIGDAGPGATVLGRTSVAADLGAEGPDGFLSLDDLDLGSSTVECDPELVELLWQAIPDAVVGAVLTVSTVTGTAERALLLQTRHPEAVAEAMEGFGVAVAAAREGIAFAELRTISNPVGPRDRAAWRIPDALAALERAGAALVHVQGRGPL